MRVRLFARLRELAGADVVEIELREGATVADLRAAIALAAPKLADAARRCAVAVDEEFAEDATPISGREEIALIPPVSGG